MSENKKPKFLRKKADTGFKLVIPFFLALTVLTIVSFVIPLRPTQSYTEKRNLAEFPDFSVEALVSGSYFDDITDWFSDTFPGRESWISLSDYISGLHGHSEITIQGDIPVGDDFPMELPEEPAPSEPSSTEQTISSDSTEPAAEDQEETEPLEEDWGGVEMNTDDLIRVNSVIQIGDSAFSGLGFSANESARYTKTISTFADKMAEKGVRVVSAPPPTAIGIMVEEEYLEMLRSVSQQETLSYMHSPMSSNVLAVDTVSALLAHNDEYIYFRTDHHWTALGAYYSYEAVCKALGYTPAPLDSFEEWDQGEFKGSLYGKAGRPGKLRLDNLMAYVPQGDIHMQVYDKAGKGYELPMLADTTQRDTNAKYLTFLSSDHALCEITNNSLPDGPSCIVVKDSYGNCFAPFLTQNYHKVYAIDYRKFSWMKLQKFVDEYDIDDVIFMPYMTATQSSLGNDFLEKLCRDK